MDKYAETKQIISDMAAVKMQMNNHKGAIEEKHPDQIIKSLLGEVDELETAVSNQDMLNIIEEAADVMNFLVGIVHQQVEKYRSRK